MPIQPHILSPLSSAWPWWVMLALLLCAVLSEATQPGAVVRAFTVLQVKANKRSYKSAPENFFGQFFVALFRLGVLSLALQLCLYDGETFRFATYAAISGVILAMWMIKMIANLWIDYTFMLSRRYEDVYEQYGHMVTLSALLLYPCLLVLLHVCQVIVARWVVGIIVVLFLLFLLYRMVRVFYQTPLSVVYILIYFLTLEALPLAALWVLTTQMITLI